MNVQDKRVQDREYEEPDLGESSVPRASTVLTHEYLELERGGSFNDQIICRVSRVQLP